jgi:hypothetical protein
MEEGKADGGKLAGIEWREKLQARGKGAKLD